MLIYHKLREKTGGQDGQKHGLILGLHSTVVNLGFSSLLTLAKAQPNN